jgi:hypothetical protein
MKSALLVLGIFFSVGAFVAIGWGWPSRSETSAEKQLIEKRNAAFRTAAELGTNDLKLMQLYSDAAKAGVRLGHEPHYASDDYYTTGAQLEREREALLAVRGHHWTQFKGIAGSLGIFAAVSFVLAAVWPKQKS